MRKLIQESLKKSKVVDLTNIKRIRVIINIYIYIFNKNNINY